MLMSAAPAYARADRFASSQQFGWEGNHARSFFDRAGIGASRSFSGNNLHNVLGGFGFTVDCDNFGRRDTGFHRSRRRRYDKQKRRRLDSSLHLHNRFAWTLRQYVTKANGRDDPRVEYRS
jgi:hypothetical protein